MCDDLGVKWLKMNLKKISFSSLCVFLYGGLLGLLASPTSDDFYFGIWKFNSLKNMFLLHPDNFPHLSWCVPNNGRYLGNLVGLLLAKSYNLTLGHWIRGLVIGLTLLTVFLLLKSLCKVEKRQEWILALGIVFTPLPMVVQVYIWMAGAGNYLISVPFLLVVFLFLETKQQDSPLRGIVIFSCGLCSALFVEHITVYLLFLIFAYHFVRMVMHHSSTSGRFLPQQKILASGILVGVVLMFSYSGYRGSPMNDGYRSISLSSMYENYKILSLDSLVINGCLWPLAFGGLVNAEGKHSRVYKSLLGLYCLFGIYSLYRTVTVDLAEASYRRMDMPAAALQIVCLCLLAWQMRKGLVRTITIQWILSMGLINGMLLFVSPVSTRCSYVCYILTLIWAVKLFEWGYAEKKEHSLSGKMRVAGGFIIALIYCLSIFVPVFHNRLCYLQMKEYLNRLESTENKKLVLPIFPEDKYIYVADGGIYYMYTFFDKEPGDTFVELMHYEDWRNTYQYVFENNEK